MIEPMKRAADMAVVPSAVKRPRTELIAAAQSQQLVATVRRVAVTTTGRGGYWSRLKNLEQVTTLYCVRFVINYI